MKCANHRPETWCILGNFFSASQEHVRAQDYFTRAVEICESDYNIGYQTECRFANSQWCNLFQLNVFGDSVARFFSNFLKIFRKLVLIILRSYHIQKQQFLLVLESSWNFGISFDALYIIFVIWPFEVIFYNLTQKNIAQKILSGKVIKSTHIISSD